MIGKLSKVSPCNFLHLTFSTRYGHLRSRSQLTAKLLVLWRSNDDDGAIAAAAVPGLGARGDGDPFTGSHHLAQRVRLYPLPRNSSCHVGSQLRMPLTRPPCPDTPGGRRDQPHKSSRSWREVQLQYRYDSKSEPHFHLLFMVLRLIHHQNARRPHVHGVPLRPNSLRPTRWPCA